MIRKLLALMLFASMLAACASWFGGSSAPNNPNVGSKDSSDFLFGQAASAPVASSAVKQQVQQRQANASSAK